MKRACWQIVPTIVGLVALSTTAFAQDLLKAEDGQTDMVPGIFASGSEGSQDKVRQYDGRKFNVWGIEQLNSYGYSGDHQYWFAGRDLIGGDEDISFSLNGRNEYGISVATSAMTHRFARIPAINPYLAPFGMSQIVGGVPSGDAFLDLSPTGSFRLDRRVNQFSANSTPANYGWLRLTGGIWQENESGNEQLLFRARATTPGVITSGTRGAVSIPIDRTTNESTLGADMAIGRRSVLNYQFVNTAYSDGGTRPTGVPGTVFPLNLLTRFDSKTNASIFKANSRITSKLFFTGVHINRQRENTTAAVPTAASGTNFVGAGTPLGHTMSTDTTNLGLTFLPTDAVTLTGRWRKYTQDDQVPGVLAVGAASPTNDPLSRDITSWELNGSYTGIRRAFIDAGFERRDEKLSSSLLGSAEEFGVPFTAPSTKTNIWSTGVRYYPTERLSLSGKWQNAKDKDPALFSGVPTENTKINANATYLVRDNISLFGDFNSSDQKNTQFRVDPTDPALGAISTKPSTPASIADILEKREDAAGQGFRNKFTTWDAGLWYGITSKLSLDTFFGRVKTDSAALLVIGNDASNPPLLPADFAPFQATSDEWDMGLTYAVTPRLRTHGRYANVLSRGQTTLSVIPGSTALTQGWQPIDIRENRWTAGFDYQVSAAERLIVEYTLSDWRDRINSANDGKLHVWNIAWAHQY